mmetsp:Transcript_28283/g.76611  ORF Transcript_28283/g.76611 Transcript_28283/m.76611 type:complete len:355 (-) Transcript_28283:89-1153(-)|eukprot:CAMPEP_0171175070 /NCGR_PEP_ID=MMETSP0790-20130122/11045_1 /TAXON_ID=2925 /ORGANISM="Alexandrium catenella, Strain OF101" /LENGTH=354 /DNA_ID=CAMNT_0011639947 /DNA_START=88 /DNA_END=1152 /DNA_ORIENTATION=+
MSSQPLIQADGNAERGEEPAAAQESGKMKCLKICGLGTCGCLLTVFVLVWLLQGWMYLWATNLQGCRPGALQGFNYDGDADPQDDPAKNLVPMRTILHQRAPWTVSVPFDVFLASEATREVRQVGTWWRIWGPIFYTYTYEDMLSMTTIYMRRNLLRLGSSHRMARCDGKGPMITLTEGTNWFGNRMRTLFRYKQAQTFKIYLDDNLVGMVEETTGEAPSLTLRNMNLDVLGSAVLNSPAAHPDAQEWFVTNNETMPMPYFVGNAASLLYAFHEMGAVRRRYGGSPSFMAQVAKAAQQETPASVILAAPERASAAAHTTAAVAAQEAPAAAVAASAVEKKEAAEVHEKVELEHV